MFAVLKVLQIVLFSLVIEYIEKKKSRDKIENYLCIKIESLAFKIPNE